MSILMNIKRREGGKVLVLCQIVEWLYENFDFGHVKKIYDDFFEEKFAWFINNVYLCNRKATMAVAPLNGTLAEWLGNGLQNRVQQFESARYLMTRGCLF